MNHSLSQALGRRTYFKNVLLKINTFCLLPIQPPPL
jgi:hypothetical protein